MEIPLKCGRSSLVLHVPESAARTFLVEAGRCAPNGEERELIGSDAIIDRIAHEFVLGGHKAAAVASVMKQADIFPVSTLPADLVRAIGFTPFESLDKALQLALDHVETAPTIAVILAGGSVVPVVAQAPCVTTQQAHRASE